MNILRLMGQGGLPGPDAPVRHAAKRRRLKTVMQELIYRAGRLIQSGRRNSRKSRLPRVSSRRFESAVTGRTTPIIVWFNPELAVEVERVWERFSGHRLGPGTNEMELASHNINK